jgi:hypothetical protein
MPALVAGPGAERIFSFRSGIWRPSSCVSLAVVVAASLLLGLCVAAPAAYAERPIAADVATPLPFDAGELTAALRARLPEAGEPIVLRLSATFDGVRIETRGTAREVGLDGLTGSAAARLVALAAADLLVEETDLDPPALVLTNRQPRSTTVGVLGAAASWGHTLGGLGVDVVLPRRQFLAAIEGGAGTLVDGPVRMTAAVVRLGAGVRTGALEVRATGTVMPLVVSSGAGDRTILFGGGVAARLRIPLATDLRAIVAAGVDVFATRTTYVIDGMTALTTPRAAPWAGLGLELTP